MIPSIFHNDFLRRHPAALYVPPFVALLLGLIRHSYRVRELLACWFLFCSFLAALVLVLLGAVLAGYAGRHLFKWVSAAKAVIPELVVSLAQIPQEVSATSRILVAGTLEKLAGPYPPIDALGAHSSPLPQMASSAEEGVLKGTDTLLHPPYYL